MARVTIPIHAVAPARGLMHRNRWLLARRGVQLSVLLLFMLGPWAGVWVARGTLASSEWFGMLSLTDPFVALQALAARHTIGGGALAGAAIVGVFYLLFGGRTYCAWVCPVNLVTDASAWLRKRLGLPALLQRWRPDRRTRLAVMAGALGLSFLLGSVAWETVNPITLVQRALVFGLAGGFGVAAAVFMFDLLILPRGWCGHLCPVGAFYGLLGRVSWLRIRASAREACTHCGDCFHVCPEPHVIAPALHGGANGAPPTIDSEDCIRCGRCIDRCEVDVFEWTVTG